MSTFDSIPLDGGTAGIGGLDQVVLSPEIGQPTWVELIVVNNNPPQISIHRELEDPTSYSDVHALVAAHGYDVTTYTPYARNWFTGVLSALSWSATLSTGMIVVVVQGDVYGGFERLARVLNQQPQILPKRMVWPIL